MQNFIAVMRDLILQTDTGILFLFKQHVVIACWEPESTICRQVKFASVRPDSESRFVSDRLFMTNFIGKQKTECHKLKISLGLKARCIAFQCRME